MRGVGLAVRSLVAGSHTARLEGLAVRAGADFAVRVLTGQPDFEVIGLSRTKTHIARAAQNHAVRKPELLQNHFGVVRKFLLVLIAIVFPRNTNHFDLIELVLTNHAARIVTVGAGFRSKTRRVCRHLNRQVRILEHEAGDLIGQCHFRCRNQEEVLGGNMEHIIFKFRKLSGPDHRVAVYHERRQNFCKSVFFCMEIQHEIRF